MVVIDIAGTNISEARNVATKITKAFEVNGKDATLKLRVGNGLKNKQAIKELQAQLSTFTNVVNLFTQEPIVTNIKISSLDPFGTQYIKPEYR